MSLSRLKSNPNRIRNARILVVEANADHRLLIKNALHQSFADIELVLLTSENEAINHLDDCEQTGLRLPQLILMDLFLPNRENGWNLLNVIRNKNLITGQIPIIIISHSADSNDITKSYHMGATSYIIKPVDSTRWMDYAQTLKDYWWETASFPNRQTSY